MCSEVLVKIEVTDGVNDLSPITCGDRQGAKAGKRAPEHPAPLLSPPLTPSRSKVKEENVDDILNDLRCLFDDLNVGDSDDDSETDSGCATPRSPRSKQLDLPGFPPIKTYFCAGARLYSFDDEHNVYLEEAGSHSVLIISAPMNDNMLDMLNPSFYLEGVAYYFDIFGNLLFNNQGTICPVDTLVGSSTFDQALPTPFTPGNFVQSNPAYPSGSNTGYPEFQQYTQTSVPSGAFCDETKAKTESESEYFPDPLHNSFKGTMPWSPSSSTLSPIVTNTSRASSETFEPLIGPEQPQGYIAGIQIWQQETKVIQAVRNSPPIGKMDRRRCPECSKVFRRPSSLEDHLNVHSGAKPHMCPFERCKTGFATKSNMKRHFATHRAGSLEEYVRGGKLDKSKALTATYNAKAFHTQRFRLT